MEKELKLRDGEVYDGKHCLPYSTKKNHCHGWVAVRAWDLVPASVSKEDRALVCQGEFDWINQAYFLRDTPEIRALLTRNNWPRYTWLVWIEDADGKISWGHA